jgi:dolichol-phosphate mannosyltransferase
MSNRSLDVLVPVFNEAEVLDVLFQRLASLFATEKIQELKLSRVRFVFIDDGSRDETARRIADRIREGFPGLLIRLSRNFGHQSALSAGFDHADADFIAVIDADLQDPPELVGEMIRKLDEGFDVVYGQRRSRTEGPLKKLAYWAFYRFLAIISEIQVPVDAGDFCVMKREVLVAMRKLPEKLRFHRGLRSWVGFRQAAFPYDRPERTAGDSKYTFSMLYELATNGVASLTIRPLRITQAVLFFSMIVTVGFVILGARWYLISSPSNPQTFWFLMTQTLVAFTSCLQIFCLYMLGAYVGRMYLEVKSRPAYIVMETFGLQSGPRNE